MSATGAKTLFLKPLPATMTPEAIRSAIEDMRAVLDEMGRATFGDMRDVVKVKIPAVAADIATVAGDVATAGGQITTLQGDLATASAAVAALQGDLADADAAIADVVGDVAAANTAIAGVASDLATANGLLGGRLTAIEDDVLTIPMADGITFSVAGATVSWTGGKLHYGTQQITINAGSTTDSYVYYDFYGAHPNTLSHSAAAPAIGKTATADVWLLCVKEAAGKLNVAAVSALVHAGLIQANAITAGAIAADAVTATKILAGAVTAAAIATDAVTAVKILAGAVTADKIAADAVTAVKILAGCITSDKIAANAITATQILAGAVTAGKINVASLSAIAADLGTITSGSITLNLGSSVNRMRIDSSGIYSSIDSGATWKRIIGLIDGKVSAAFDAYDDGQTISTIIGSYEVSSTTLIDKETKNIYTDSATWWSCKTPITIVADAAVAADVYDSGWFAVAAASNYPLTHNLGSTALETTVWFAPDSAGAPDLANASTGLQYLSSSAESGPIVQGLTLTQLTLKTGKNYAGVTFDSDGDGVFASTGWCRVLARRLSLEQIATSDEIKMEIYRSSSGDTANVQLMKHLGTATTQNITGITKAAAATVLLGGTITGSGLFNPGDWITISGVLGMTQMNGTWRISSVPSDLPDRIIIDVDSRAFSTYTSGGQISMDDLDATPELAWTFSGVLTNTAPFFFKVANAGKYTLQIKGPSTRATVSVGKQVDVVLRGKAR